MSAADLAAIREEQTERFHGCMDRLMPFVPLNLYDEIIKPLERLWGDNLAALDRIEQNTLTPEEARWIADLIRASTERYADMRKVTGALAKLERIAGDTGEATA